MGSAIQDGIRIAERFAKAKETILVKHAGDITKAQAEVNGLAKYKFGLTLDEYNDMVKAGHFGRLAIQKNRHEHMLAQERESKKKVQAANERIDKAFELVVIEPGM